MKATDISIIRRRHSSRGKFSYALLVPQSIGDQIYDEENTVIFRAEVLKDGDLIFRRLERRR